MKLTTLITATLIGIAPAIAQDSDDTYQDSQYSIRSTDCGAPGQEPIVIDTGAGKVWTPVNTSTWCEPIGQTLNPVNDPTFASGG